jgi:hypothetical protein
MDVIMKTKLLFFLLASCLLALATWLVQVPNQAQADDVPEKYRDTVSKGLEYLAKNQHMDGHWEGDGGKHPVAVTSLAGIALLMEGSTVQKGKYSANIRKAVAWLTDKSQAGGLIFSNHTSETDRYMFGHGLATQFLAWDYRHESDEARQKKLTDVLTRAAKYIVKAQSTQGGWYKTSKLEGHDFDQVSATAIQIQALYIVGNLGIPVRSETVAADGQEYLNKALAKFEAAAKPGPDRNRPAETAAALACRCCPDAFLDQDGLCSKWFKYCQTEIPVGRGMKFGRDELTHYYYAQAVFSLMLNPEFNVGTNAETWSQYRKAMFDHLQSSQNKDGSWPAPLDAQGRISIGPVYSAAMWCTILQLDKKNHPLTQQRLRATF